MAEQTVAQAGLARTAEVFATGVSSHRRRLGHRPGGRRVHRHPTRRARATASGSDRAAPFRVQVTWSRSKGKWLVDDFTPGDGTRPSDRRRRAPSWYDLLGVEPDASADEIRAAWKAAIADLDPGDRRFRALNQAAEVLLDPDAAGGVRRRRWRRRSPSRTRRDADGAGPAADDADGRRASRARRRRSRLASPGWSPPGCSPASRCSWPRCSRAAVLPGQPALRRRDRRRRPATPRPRPSGRRARSCPTTTATSTRTRRPPGR